MIIGYTDQDGEHQVTTAPKARDVILMLNDLKQQKAGDESVLFCWAGYQEGEKIVKMFISE
jgi:hypothetical protein